MKSNLLLIASEIYPFAKTGGLGDMVGTLGRALRGLGKNPVYILPKYRSVPADSFEPLTLSLKIPIGDRSFDAGIWKGMHPHGIPTYLLDIPELFDRPSFYGEGGHDYPDNCARFTAFSRGTLEMIRALKLPCDILHCHDWQTALIPLYLKTLYAGDPLFAPCRTILTLHNMGYQGLFPASDFPLTGLGPDFSSTGLEYYGQMNLLKGGILAADAVTTVSPSYAREILTPEFGFGLEGILREKAVTGILNGIDTVEWNPSTDPHLPAPFSVDRLQGKWVCRQALRREMNLPEKDGTLLVSMMSRLVDQKGADLVAAVIPTLEEAPLQWVILGEGDPRIEGLMADLARTYPDRVAARIGFAEPLAHRIAAGSDLLLLPSRYEPCGLSQMFAQCYGSIPIVRKTGGLIDTVTDVTESGEGTGFLFHEPSVGALRETILRAVASSRNEMFWKTVQERAMRRDFSWDRSMAAYADLYEKVRGLT